MAETTNEYIYRYVEKKGSPQKAGNLQTQKNRIMKKSLFLFYHKYINNLITVL